VKKAHISRHSRMDDRLVRVLVHHRPTCVTVYVHTRTSLAALHTCISILDYSWFHSVSVRAYLDESKVRRQFLHGKRRYGARSMEPGQDGRTNRKAT